MNGAVRRTATFLVFRVAAAIVTLFMLAAIVFLMVKLIPGDEAHVAAGQNATPAQVAAVRHHLGLDRPLPVQFEKFVVRLLHGDLGTSVTTHNSVAGAILQVIPGTIELVIVAMGLMVAVVFPLATISAVRRDRGVDLTLRVAVIVAAGLPTYWLALMLQYLLAARWHLVPISGELSRGVAVHRHSGSVLLDALFAGRPAAFWDGLRHVVLPAAVLALPFGAQLYRTLRTELIRVLGRDHITVARAKGIVESRLVLRHALPNAMGPAITVLGVQFGGMVGAAVLVESVFGLGGIGSYLTNAVGQRDTFAVLGGVIMIGALVVLSSLGVDILQLIRDPRLRAGQIGG